MCVCVSIPPLARALTIQNWSYYYFNYVCEVCKEILEINPSVPCISERCIKTKFNLNFLFTLLCGVSKGFMRAYKTFVKTFEAPQRSVKTKI